MDLIEVLVKVERWMKMPIKERERFTGVKFPTTAEAIGRDAREALFLERIYAKVCKVCIKYRDYFLEQVHFD